MKEATGEGSMTVITIVVIAALGVAAAVLVGYFLTQTKESANDATGQTVTEQENLNGMLPQKNQEG